jgi:threonine/homoserine/homoserine lactone efflux protein
VASITPGPTNVIALSYGGKLSFYRILPFIIGASLGTGLILFMTSMGLTRFLFSYDFVKPMLGLLGATWLSVMAFKLFNHGAVMPLSESDLNERQRLTWVQGGGLQFVNPKSWMMSITVASLYPSQGLSALMHYVVLAGIFALIAIPCISAWAYLGKLASRHLQDDKQQILLNQALAILLFLSVWWAYIQA